MSIYPGNTSLDSTVKERVNSTFRQSIELYKQGRIDDVVAGCTLILQMDPLFDPARKLLDKAKNPSLPIDMESLMPTGANEDINEARAAMASRDFERVLQVTSAILTNDLMNEEARILADDAREKIEAGPFIDQFVRKCDTSLNNGNLSAARADLEKARALDSSHPGVARIEAMIKAREAAAPAASSSSFVVETPAPAQGRSTAQASDFGFTFEEDKGAEKPLTNFSFDSVAAPPPAEKPADSGFSNFSFEPETPASGGFSFDTPVATPAPAAGFSFDAPAAPTAAAPPAASSFDFSTASIETTPDDQKKIEQYLADGDRAFDSGNYQQGIDLWSRIFLIDVTNEAASERIEKAKAKRRESEQRIEGVLASGVQAFERKDMTTARARFSEVLQMDPNHVTAQDYMERLDTPESAPSYAAEGESGSYDSGVLDDEAVADADADAAPTAAAPARRTKGAVAPVVAPARARGKSTGLIAMAVIALVVVAGGWFAWSKFMSEPEQNPAAARAMLDRATEFSQQGKYDQAISVLQDIQPGDSQYDKALVMIADLQQKKSRATQNFDGKPAAAFYQENLAAGRAALDAHDYVAAKRAFEQAMRVKPLPADAKAAYDAAAQQVNKLASATTLFAERKYGDAIVSLQSLQQQDPSNQNIQRMIIDAHFNMGALALQEERIDEARRQFEEVLKSDPNDELAKRSRELADRYNGQPKDLLYKIYVKYLPLRQAAA